MNITKLIKDVKSSSWDNVRAISLVGDDVLVSDALDRIESRDSDKVIVRIYPKTSQELFEFVAHNDADAAPRLVVAYNGNELLKDSDLPRVSRFLHKNYFVNRLVLTGSKPIDDEEVAAQFKRGMTKTYLLSFSSTETGKKQFVEWLADVGNISARNALTIAQEVNYDPSMGYNVARKVSYFPRALEDRELKILSEDFKQSPFANSLMMLKPADAMRAIDDFPIRTLPMVLDNMAKSVRTVGQIYPLTRQAKVPGKQQVIDSKINLNVLLRWWSVAGRYPPREQIRRQLLVVETSHRYSYNKEYKGILESLVLAW